jgi:hypothetical protein
LRGFSGRAISIVGSAIPDVLTALETAAANFAKNK